jgi:hypothetical protein
VNKFRNRKTVVDGLTFDSAKEARRWSELRLLERAGQITDLVRQEPIRLEVNGKLVCKFIPDFCYVENGQKVVEDVKSPATRKLPAYRIKVKLLEALTRIRVRET